MWEINKENQMIRMTKGDTISFKVECNIKGEDGKLHPYIPEDEDIFIFACKSKYDEEPLFTIEIPNDTMICTFKEEDTKYLELGKYVYEISLNKPSIDYHCTFIENKLLFLTVEVY